MQCPDTRLTDRTDRVGEDKNLAALLELETRLRDQSIHVCIPALLSTRSAQLCLRTWEIYALPNLARLSGRLREPPEVDIDERNLVLAEEDRIGLPLQSPSANPSTTARPTTSPAHHIVLAARLSGDVVILALQASNEILELVDARFLEANDVRCLFQDLGD